MTCSGRGRLVRQRNRLQPVVVRTPDVAVECAYITLVVVVAHVLGDSFEHDEYV